MTPKTVPCLAANFWEPNSDTVLQLLFREIVFPKQVQVPPGNR